VETLERGNGVCVWLGYLTPLFSLYTNGDRRLCDDESSLFVSAVKFDVTEKTVYTLTVPRLFSDEFGRPIRPYVKRNNRNTRPAPVGQSRRKSVSKKINTTTSLKQRTTHARGRMYNNNTRSFVISKQLPDTDVRARGLYLNV